MWHYPVRNGFQHYENDEVIMEVTELIMSNQYVLWYHN
jgi:hypothetical protein